MHYEVLAVFDGSAMFYDAEDCDDLGVYYGVSSVHSNILHVYYDVFLQEYVQCVKKLMNSLDLKVKLSSNAKRHLMQSFSPEKERELYGQLLKQLE